MQIEIKYHKKFYDDAMLLSRQDQDRVESVIINKLKTNPMLFGKPLRHGLKNYRSLRIGKYRLGFKLDANIVYVLGIVHRSRAYEEFLKRSGN